MQTLFTARTTNGNSEPVSYINIGTIAEQPATVYVWGEFDGATVTVQVSPDGSEWFDTSGVLTAKGAVTVTLAAAALRLNIADAGASTEINAGVV